MHRASKIDYSGRKSDILLLRTVYTPCEDGKVSVDVSKEQPHIVSGIEKMAQRYTLFFLSQAGTCALEPDKGTDLIGDLSSGKIYNTETLGSAVARAKAYADASMSSSEEDGDPDDEILSSSEILGVSMESGNASATISIKLISKSGDSYTYVTPVPIGV